MNNPVRQFIYALFLCLGVSLWNSAVAQQKLPSSTLTDVQMAYTSGDIGVDEAVIKQFEMLYEPSDTEQFHKCATPAFMFYRQHEGELSASTKEKVLALRNSSVQAKKTIENHQIYISPSGKFEIFYSTSGSDSVSVTDEDGNGVPDYVEWVAEAADSSYRHEVLRIGFKDPIPEGAKYTLYVENTGGSYGYTETVAQSAGEPETEIYVENDFEGFPPNTHPEGDQKGALFATIAHEFKHAIQYAQNRWRSPSGAFNWAEMDATLMEEVVYDDVNDYYNYIKNGLDSTSPYFDSIFYRPHQGTPGAYWHVSWMVFYTEYFGNKIWRDAWQMIEGQNSLALDEALVELLPEYGDTFENSFIRNHLWHFASGSRAGEDDYGFEEKRDYPYANMEKEFSSVPLDTIAIKDIEPLAARYFEITPSSFDEGSIDVAVDFDSSQVGIGLLFYLKEGGMEEVISTGKRKSQVYVPSSFYWEEVERIGIVVGNFSNNVSSKKLNMRVGKSGNSIPIRDPKFADLPKEIKVYQNYPNPFNPTTNIDFELPRTAQVKLDVYDIMGRQIQTLANGTFRLGTYSIPFDGRELSSGTYLYRLQIDGRSITKKMLLVK